VTNNPPNEMVRDEIVTALVRRWTQPGHDFVLNDLDVIETGATPTEVTYALRGTRAVLEAQREAKRQKIIRETGIDLGPHKPKTE